MKNILIFCLYVVLIFGVNSCNKNVVTIPSDLENEILFQNENVIIEKVINDSEALTDIKLELSTNLKSTNLSELDFSNTLKYKFQNTDIEYFIIGNNKDLNTGVIAFKKEDLVFAVKSEFSIYNGISSFSLTMLDDSLYFSVELNEQNTILGLIENSVGSFSNDFTSKLGIENYNKSATGITATCNESTSNFFACYACSIRELTDDLLGYVACGIAPQACLTAALIHCAIPQ